MTPEEYNQNLSDLYGLVSKDLAGDTVFISGAELLISIKQRITNEGRNSSDGAIGNYSTKPIYAGRQAFVKQGSFNAQGKNNVLGNTLGDKLIPSIRLKTTSVKRNPAKYSKYTLVKPDYTERKTMYLKDGYKELRDVQGLRTDIVNFKYRGDLINSYQMQKTAQLVLLGLTDEKNAKKREGLENRFGNVFYATPQEQQTYIDRTNFLLQKLTVNTLQGYNVTAEIT